MDKYFLNKISSFLIQDNMKSDLMLIHQLVFLLIAKSNWFGEFFTTINLNLISQLSLTLTGKLTLFLKFQFLRSLPIALDERSFLAKYKNVDFFIAMMIMTVNI